MSSKFVKTFRAKKLKSLLEDKAKDSCAAACSALPALEDAPAAKEVYIKLNERVRICSDKWRISCGAEGPLLRAWMDNAVVVNEKTCGICEAPLSACVPLKTLKPAKAQLPLTSMRDAARSKIIVEGWWDVELNDVDTWA